MKQGLGRDYSRITQMSQVSINWSDMLRRNGMAWGLTAGFGLSLIVGCSRTPPAPATGQSEPDSESAVAPPGKSGGSGSAAHGTGTVASASAKGPMIGDIPLNVWLDNPIAESKKTGAAAPAAKPGTAEKPGETVATATKAAPLPNEPAKPAAGGDDWASVISGEDLQGEIKKIKLELQDHLSAIGKYNAHYKEDIMANGSVLGGLAAIAIVHPEKVSWKEHAAQVRDISAELVKKSKGLGQKPFDETKKEFEKIEGLLSGNPPPDLPDSDKNVPFSEAVSRRGLMKRLQTSSDYLRANFQTEAAFTKGSEDAAHTASIVAALTKIIGTEGYGNADENEYKEFVKGLMDANLTMMKAARDKDFAAFTEANGKVTKICNDCHTAFKSDA